MHITVIDTETTGLDDLDETVEVAGVVVDTDAREIVSWDTSLVHTDRAISWPAMATHHIQQDDLEGHLPLYVAMSQSVYQFPLAAHNAEFDRRFVTEEAAARLTVCTYRCALHLFPDAVSHSNQSLRYELGLDVSDMPEEAGGLPHRALYDAWCSAKLLIRMLERVAGPELVRLTDTPVLLGTVPFGKHRGQRWETVPKSYLSWLRRQSDLSRDVIYTLEHHGA